MVVVLGVERSSWLSVEMGQFLDGGRVEFKRFARRWNTEDAVRNESRMRAQAWSRITLTDLPPSSREEITAALIVCAS